MFQAATSFNQPIADWKVSSVTSTSYMFDQATSFHQAIGNWNVSSVRDMNYTFYNAASFNQPLADRDVSTVTNMRPIFDTAMSFNQPIWGLERAKCDNHHGLHDNHHGLHVIMVSMFESAASFNSALEDWNVFRLERVECDGHAQHV